MTQPATVGFYMETAFHYEVYKNIILALQAEGQHCTLVICDVIEPAFVREMQGWLSSLRHAQLALTTLSQLHGQRRVLSAMVSPYYVPQLAGTAHRQIRAMYGLAKDRWGHAWWNAFYDLILCYGEHSRQKLDIAGSAVVTGNPRFDDWHHQRYDQQLVSAITRNKTKPLVLYAPTYGELCSIPHWAERLNALQSECTLLIKLHHGTKLRAAEAPALALIEKYLKRNCVAGLCGLPLLAAADLVLTDNSGFMFDAIHAGKRTVLLEWPGLKELIAGNTTLSDRHSAEQIARQQIDTVRSSQQLSALLAESDSWQMPAALADFRSHYCDPWQDGQAGARAATAIIQLLTRPQPTNFYLQSLRQQLFAHG